MIPIFRHLTTPVVLAVVLSLAAACTADPPRSTSAGPLTGVCPDPVVVQADWHPEAEQGALFELLGRSGYDVDSEAELVRGRLVARGEDMGVDLEIRSGGEAIDYRTVAAELYRDLDILLGIVVTDQAIVAFDEHPTIGVVALLDVDPMMVMWDPARFDVDTIADLPADTVVNVFGPAPYLDHLVAAGIIDATQIDPRHTGTPERFVESGGSFAQQGYATADPYIYEQLTDEWERPVRFQLIHDTGWEVYGGSLVGRPDTLDEAGDCLELLVPLVQQALVDYVDDPESSNELIARLADRYDAGWRYDRDLARFAARQQVELGIVGNGHNATVGDFDLDRVERLIERARQVIGVGPTLTADRLVTNRFVDPEIGLPDRDAG